MRLAQAVFSDLAGQSVQKYSYLPEPYNDFIFAIVCRELGLIGAAVVILLCGAYYKSNKSTMNAPDTYGSLVAGCYCGSTAIQTILNIAVATSSVPNTGVALPFFSYGGTAIITALCEMGVLLNISRHSVKRLMWRKIYESIICGRRNRRTY